MKSFRSRIITAVLTASFLSIAITVFYGVRTIDQSQRLAVRDRLVSDAAMAADYYAKTGGAVEQALPAIERSQKTDPLRHRPIPQRRDDVHALGACFGDIGF